MWLRKTQGGTTIGPYTWPADGSVTEVGDEFGRTLLAIPEGGFEKVDGPGPDAEFSESPDGPPSGQVTEGGESPEDAKAPRRSRAKSVDAGAAS